MILVSWYPSPRWLPVVQGSLVPCPGCLIPDPGPGPDTHKRYDIDRRRTFFYLLLESVVGCWSGGDHGRTGGVQGLLCSSRFRRRHRNLAPLSLSSLLFPLCSPLHSTATAVTTFTTFTMSSQFSLDALPCMNTVWRIS